MKIRSFITQIAFVITLSTFVFSQRPAPEIYVAPNAAKDQTIEIRRDETAKLNEAIKPYIELAKKSYDKAKDSFLKGLPTKQSFFITTRLHDKEGRYEQVFVAVSEIRASVIKGIIASDIQLVSGFKVGDKYSFPESDLIDWTISKPDGSEEGNFVGKFLDTYQSNHGDDATVWRNQPATPERMSQRIEETALKYQDRGPVGRGILYDIGYPNGDQEYAALAGNAIVQITALTQDRDELPVARVYVLIDGKETQLKQIKSVLSEQVSNKSSSFKVFGAYREDALYILPIKFRMSAGELMADFAKNKTGFRLAVLGAPVSEDVAKLVLKPAKNANPDAGVLDAFIRREFPSFFQ